MDMGEYDYSELLAKVDNSIEETRKMRPSTRHLTYVEYLKAKHTVTKCYAAKENLPSMPKVAFVIAFGVIFQFFLVGEFITADLGGGGAWILTTLLWQLVLVGTNVLLAGNSIFCWPWGAGVITLAFLLWDIARLIGFSADTFAATFGWFTITWLLNFGFEVGVLSIMFKIWERVGPRAAFLEAYAGTEVVALP